MLIDFSPIEYIDNNIVFFKKKPTEKEFEEGITLIYYVLNIKNNNIEIRAEVKDKKIFNMYIRNNLPYYILNKIKSALKIDLLKNNPYPHPENRFTLYTECGDSEQKHINKIEKEYLKYAMKSANIFQMSQLDKDYLGYFISHNEEELDNNTKSFIYIVLDNFLDSLTHLPNRGLLEKTVNKESEILFEMEEGNIELRTIKKGYLLFSDLNNLKAMNDIYGHNVADVLLVSFGNLLKEKYKHLAHFRIGGDEFISLSDNYEELKELSDFLHSIEFNNELKIIIEKDIGLTIEENLLFFSSNGIYEIDLDNIDLKETMEKAEEIMYVNKSFLHLEFGVYNRRTEGSTDLAGKIDKTLIDKIKSSEVFNSKSWKEKYDFLSLIKKYSWSIYEVENELEFVSEENKPILIEKSNIYKDKLKKLISDNI